MKINLINSVLFNGVARFDALKIVNHLDISEKIYEKGSIVILEGELVSRIGVVVSGMLISERTTEDGASYSLSELSKGMLFGEILAASATKSPVTVLALKQSEVLFIKYESLFKEMPGLFDQQAKVINNFISSISEKYFEQNKRILLLSNKRIRDKIKGYLLSYGANPNEWFCVPHTREQQSRFLGTDRAALSRELSAMKKGGTIDYKRNMFIYYQDL